MIEDAVMVDQEKEIAYIIIVVLFTNGLSRASVWPQFYRDIIHPGFCVIDSSYIV